MTALHAGKTTDVQQSVYIQGLKMVSNVDEQMQTTFLALGVSGFSWGGGQKSTMEKGNSHLMPPAPDLSSWLSSPLNKSLQTSLECSHKCLSFIPIPRTISSTCWRDNTGCSA